MHDQPTLCECGCGQPAPIAQKTYSARGIVAGQPHRFIINHDKRQPFRWVAEDRGYVTPCHVWQGATNAKGYGRGPRRGGRQILAHRVAWIDANGPIRDGLRVLHRCDNPPCVNPDHLFLGTQAENVADMMAKGRGTKATKLSREDVAAIREAVGATNKELAVRYGTSPSNVSVIRAGKARKAG